MNAKERDRYIRALERNRDGLTAAGRGDPGGNLHPARLRARADACRRAAGEAAGLNRA